MKPNYTEADKQWTTTFFDLQGRKTKVANLKGDTVIAYADEPGRITTTDAQGGAIVYEFTARKKITKIIDPKNGVTHYAYYPNGFLQKATLPIDSNGVRREITLEFDNLGNRTKITDPSTGTTTFNYTVEGLLTSSTDALNRVASYTYDALNRIDAM